MYITIYHIYIYIIYVYIHHIHTYIYMYIYIYHMISTDIISHLPIFFDPLQDFTDCQGAAVDIGGYYRVDVAKTTKAPRWRGLSRAKSMISW